MDQTGAFSYTDQDIQAIMQAVLRIVQHYQTVFDERMIRGDGSFLTVAQALASLQHGRLGEFPQEVQRWQTSIDRCMELLMEASRIPMQVSHTISTVDLHEKYRFQE